MKPIDPASIKNIINEYHALPNEAKVMRKQGEYPSPHPGLHSLLGLVERLGFIEEDFDWMAWVERIGVDNLDSIVFLKRADLKTLRRLMSSHFRMERFRAGHIQKLFASGYMDVFFKRLENI